MFRKKIHQCRPGECLKTFFPGELSLTFINPVVCDGWVLSDITWFMFIFIFNNLLYLILKYATKTQELQVLEGTFIAPDFTPIKSWGSIWEDE